MGNYYRPEESFVARKQHKCIACLHAIPLGEKYIQQTGIHEDSHFRNRYHNECWDELNRDDVFEFSPGDVDPPARLVNQQPAGQE